VNHDAIVFVDADDTLWENYRWFEVVLAEWVEVLARHGVDRALATRTLHETEDRNIPVTGYGAAPFVRSVVEAFHLLVPQADHETRNDVAHFAKRAEATIRAHPIELLPGVAEAIPLLARHARVVVMTKGQEDEQVAKVGRSGLAAHFHAVRVVAEKHPEAYRDAVRAFGARAADCWMVGNSPASDIQPALDAGLAAIHVPHAAPWHRDLGPLDPRAVTARTFAEVPAIVLGTRAVLDGSRK
jgi:putative hydrolase of the HAD superfamily